ncbi:hypothetical protein Dsin_028817 [Dipteronia sinensis]|uniref:Uncharacterized protein n=1 Tax=Dipteronia sinensis TaxID=43782 RepID=A0AAD9ZSS0_9ROSI|nr:hypothetical protein Dsin_028817 [Dipteronia sinensis]
MNQITSLLISLSDKAFVTSMEDPSTKEEPRVLKVLEALKQASHDLQASSNDSNSSAIKALLELETESETILSKDPNLSTLSTPSQMLVFSIAKLCRDEVVESEKKEL